MNRKKLAIGIGLLVTAIALVAGARHCLRVMGRHDAAHHRRLAEACNPAACGGRSEGDAPQDVAARAA